MNEAIKYDYVGFLRYAMILKVDGDHLIEGTTMGQRRWEKVTLNEIGLFNFEYVVDRIP